MRWGRIKGGGCWLGDSLVDTAGSTEAWCAKGDDGEGLEEVRQNER